VPSACRDSGIIRRCVKLSGREIAAAIRESGNFVGLIPRNWDNFSFPGLSQVGNLFPPRCRVIRREWKEQPARRNRRRNEIGRAPFCGKRSDHHRRSVRRPVNAASKFERAFSKTETSCETCPSSRTPAGGGGGISGRKREGGRRARSKLSPLAVV